MSLDARSNLIEAPGHERTDAGIKGLETQATAVALNDNFIKNTYQPTLDAAGRASELQASIQAVRSVGLDARWDTEAEARAASMLEGLGIAPANAKFFAACAQRFQSAAMERLLTKLAAQKGSQNEGDSTRAQQNFVKLGNTPEVIEFVLDFAQAKANMDQRRAQYYEQAMPLAQISGDLTRIDREWRRVQGSIWADPLLQRWSK